MSGEFHGVSADRAARRGAVAIVALVASALLGVSAAVSWNDHPAVRNRALKSLEALSLSEESTGSGPLSLPVGRVEATSPLAHASAVGSSGGSPGFGPSLPVGGSTATLSSAPVTPGSLPGNTAPSATVPVASTPASKQSGGVSPGTTSEVTVAVLTPLLDTFQFGASVGFLLVCNTGAGALSAAAAQVPGLSKVIAPVISQISPLCSKMSTAAVGSLTELNDQLRVLSGLTPGTAPFFAEANQVWAVLDRLAPQLEPLSGTLTAIGPLVEFFQGLSS